MGGICGLKQAIDQNLRHLHQFNPVKCNLFTGVFVIDVTMTEYSAYSLPFISKLIQKTMNGRVKFMGAVIMALLMLSGLNSCQKDKDEKSVKDYLSVDGATYVSGSIPAASSGDAIPEIANVTGNSSVIEGGSNPIAVYASVPASKILVGVQGAKGYYEYTGTTKSTAVIYTLSLVLSTSIPGEGFVITIVIVDDNGLISEIFELPVSIIAVGTGQLQVSLSWDQPNDVDLHLVEPNGEEIYYVTDYSSNGGVLDLDSNPGCYIDGVQNENITYSDESTVQAGTYTVRIDLYDGCDVTAQTNYIVTARLNGQLIAQQSITNPYNGSFPAGSAGDNGGSGSGVQVMQFTLSASQLKSTGSATFNAIRFPSARESASISDKKSRAK
jgi:hypothetical protein